MQARHPIIEWAPSLETGDARVDGQHQTIVRMFNEFQTAEAENRESEVLGDLMVRLLEYVAVHFATEEGLMDRFDYPESERGPHVEQHAALTARARELVLAHRNDDEGTSAALSAILADWLVEHFQVYDRRLVEHVRDARSETLGA